MAEAFARHFSTEIVKVESAGTIPYDKVNPMVVEAMKEQRIDMSAKIPLSY